MLVRRQQRLETVAACSSSACMRWARCARSWWRTFRVWRRTWKTVAMVMELIIISWCRIHAARCLLDDSAFVTNLTNLFAEACMALHAFRRHLVKAHFSGFRQENL